MHKNIYRKQMKMTSYYNAQHANTKYVAPYSLSVFVEYFILG